MKENAVTEYEDIMTLPHHVSADRPHMSMNDRAAQFAGFSVLEGLDIAIASAVPEEERYYYDEEEENQQE